MTIVVHSTLERIVQDPAKDVLLAYYVPDSPEWTVGGRAGGSGRCTAPASMPAGYAAPQPQHPNSCFGRPAGRTLELPSPAHVWVVPCAKQGLGLSSQAAPAPPGQPSHAAATPACPLRSQALSCSLVKLAKRFKDVESVVIAKMDSSANEHAALDDLVRQARRIRNK